MAQADLVVLKRLEIVNESGNLIMSLGSDHYGREPEIRMYSSDGHELVVLFTRPLGEAGISILSETGQVKVSICSRESSHGMVVYDDNGELVYEAVWPDLSDQVAPSSGEPAITTEDEAKPPKD